MGKDKRQNLDITETGTPLAGAFEAISLYSAATRAQRIIMALWTAHAPVYKLFPVSVILNFVAPGPGCGKSVHLNVLTHLCPNPLVVGYSSQASVHNYLDSHPETAIGIDEMDKAFGATGRKTTREILHAVINGSYDNTPALVTRNGEAVVIKVYCPMVLAGIGRLPQDMRERSIEITLEKKQPPETYLSVLHESGLHVIADSMKEWLGTEEAQAELRKAPPLADVPGDPRYRLNMAPLAAIARYAGMYEQFLAAEREIRTGVSGEPVPTMAEMLVADLVRLWPAGKRMLSAAEIIAMLHAGTDHRWDRLQAAEPGSSGRVGEVALASLLAQRGIRTRTSNGRRGYRRSDLGEQSEHRTQNTEQDVPVLALEEAA